MPETTSANKVSILSEFWMEFRGTEEFKPFFEFHDLDLPLAYCISHGIVESTQRAEDFINEAWRSLLERLEIDEDYGFENLEDLVNTTDQIYNLGE